MILHTSSRLSPKVNAFLEASFGLQLEVILVFKANILYQANLLILLVLLLASGACEMRE